MSDKANTNVSNATSTGLQKCVIKCAIRRRPNLVGLPGQDPAERVYKIGASLDRRTKGNLKGISGELELKFMPEIVGLSTNDPKFRASVEEYWSSIGRPVPPDEPFLKDYEKGIKVEIHFTLLGSARKDRFLGLNSIEEKIEYLNKALLATEGEDGRAIATLDFDSQSDYLLLNYALKYSKVANTFDDVDKSPKIEFYIYEKSVSVKAQLSTIELRKKAMDYYGQLEGDINKTNAVLLMYGESLPSFDTHLDKLLRIDELYNSSPTKLKDFVDCVGDNTWETKYLINMAIKGNQLKNPANTTAYYYNELMLGTSIEEVVLFLNNDEKGKAIKLNLIKETKER